MHKQITFSLLTVLALSSATLNAEIFFKEQDAAALSAEPRAGAGGPAGTHKSILIWSTELEEDAAASAVPARTLSISADTTMVLPIELLPLYREQVTQMAEAFASTGGTPLTELIPLFTADELTNALKEIVTFACDKIAAKRDGYSYECLIAIDAELGGLSDINDMLAKMIDSTPAGIPSGETSRTTSLKKNLQPARKRRKVKAISGPVAQIDKIIVEHENWRADAPAKLAEALVNKRQYLVGMTGGQSKTISALLRTHAENCADAGYTETQEVYCLAVYCVAQSIPNNSSVIQKRLIPLISALIPMLMTMLTDEGDKGIRATYCLAKLAEHAGLPLRKQLLPTIPNLITALEAGGSRGENALACLAKLAAHKAPAVRKHLNPAIPKFISALSNRSISWTQKFFAELAKHKTPEVREKVINAIPKLIAALADGGAKEYNAVTCLSRLAYDAPAIHDQLVPAIPKIIPLVEADEDDTSFFGATFLLRMAQCRPTAFSAEMVATMKRIRGTRKKVVVNNYIERCLAELS